MRRTVDQGVLLLLPVVAGRCCACPLLSCPVGHERRDTVGDSGLKHFPDAAVVDSGKSDVWCGRRVPTSKDVTSKT